MSWQRDDSRFDEGFAYAEDYYKSSGNLDVKSTFIAADGFRLGTWVHAQRNRYKNGKLSADRISRLETMGMEWTPTKDNWEIGFAHLKAYCKENGNTDVPSGYVCEDGYKLGMWLTNQKSRNRIGKLTEERAKKLEALGVTWANDYKLRCDEGYAHLLEYRKLFHHASPPATYVCRDEYRLGNWLQSQKRACKSGKLDNGRIDRLQMCGVKLGKEPQRNLNALIIGEI